MTSDSWLERIRQERRNVLYDGIQTREGGVRFRRARKRVSLHPILLTALNEAISKRSSYAVAKEVELSRVAILNAATGARLNHPVYEAIVDWFNRKTFGEHAGT